MKLNKTIIFLTLSLLFFSFPSYSLDFKTASLNVKGFATNVKSYTLDLKDKIIPGKSKRNDGSFEKDKGEVIGGNTGEQIQIYMKKQAQRFSSIKGALISTIREGEVLKVSIPTNYIFQPNDTNFVEQADLRLRPILVFMRKNLTTLIVTSHTDNTGSEQFLQKSCFERACRIEDWFLSNGVKVENMSVYSMVDTQPLYDNDSMENRSKNRRITFYLVPNKEMIKLAKKNKLN